MENKIEKRKWFKFYGSDFLLDPKMMELNSTQKVMWVVLLCLASSNGDDGWVKHINDIRLATFAGITPLDDDYELVKGTLDHFKALSMITYDNVSETVKNVHLTNFNKRQETNLTGYERVKKHREKVKLSTESDKTLSMITADKIREDKRRLNNNIVEIQKIYDLYISKFNKNPNQYRLTDKRKSKIKARLVDAGPDMLVSAIERSSVDPFYAGDNDRGWSADLDYITRSYENVEKLSQLEAKRKTKITDHIPYVPPVEVRESDGFTGIGDIARKYG